MEALLTPLLLSLRVTGAALVLVVPLGLLLAHCLAFGRFRGKALLETFLTLPLVLPPTVVGYALLQTLGHGTAFGQWLNERAGLRLLFTWQGAALAGAVMALPLFVRTAAAALASLPRTLIDAARLDGATSLTLFLRVLLPLAQRGLRAATLLATARALGEFGATLMVAGAIPGQTETLPLALYSAVQAGQDARAAQLALTLAVLAFLLVTLVTRQGGQDALDREP